MEGGKDPSTMSCEAYLCSYVVGSAASSSNIVILLASDTDTLLFQKSWKWKLDEIGHFGA